MNVQWYALRLKPHCEFWADEELDRVGIERFTPTFKRRTLVRYTKGREKVLTIPLMTGFTFARLDYGPRSRHPTLLKEHCKHVIGPIRVCGVPAPIIGEGMMAFNHLRLLCEAGHYDQGRQRGWDKRFKDGDLVRFTGGAFASQRGIFRETAGGLRPRSGFVRVAMEMLFGQRDFETDVPLDLVEAA